MLDRPDPGDHRSCWSRSSGSASRSPGSFLDALRRPEPVPAGGGRHRPAASRRSSATMQQAMLYSLRADHAVRAAVGPDHADQQHADGLAVLHPDQSAALSPSTSPARLSGRASASIGLCPTFGPLAIIAAVTLTAPPWMFRHGSNEYQPVSRCRITPDFALAVCSPVARSAPSFTPPKTDTPASWTQDASPPAEGQAQSATSQEPVCHRVVDELRRPGTHLPDHAREQRQSSICARLHCASPKRGRSATSPPGRNSRPYAPMAATRANASASERLSPRCLAISARPMARRAARAARPAVCPAPSLPSPIHSTSINGVSTLRGRSTFSAACGAHSKQPMPRRKPRSKIATTSSFRCKATSRAPISIFAPRSFAARCSKTI